MVFANVKRCRMCVCIQIWDKQTLECLKILTGHTGSVLCLQYDERVIVTGSSDSTVRSDFYRSLAFYKSSVHFSTPPPPITPHVCSAGMSKGLIKSALTSLAISFYPEFGMWTRGRFWTLWSITTRPCSTCDSVTGWWSPARRIAPSPCGTWPLPQTSASAESSSDTGPPSMWSTLTTSTLSLPLVIGP